MMIRATLLCLAGLLGAALVVAEEPPTCVPVPTTCHDTCPLEGESRCEGLEVATCAADGAGCLSWQAAPCPQGEGCVDGACAIRPPAALCEEIGEGGCCDGPVVTRCVEGRLVTESCISPDILMDVVGCHMTADGAACAPGWPEVAATCPWNRDCATDTDCTASHHCVESPFENDDWWRFTCEASDPCPNGVCIPWEHHVCFETPSICDGWGAVGYCLMEAVVAGYYFDYCWGPYTEYCDCSYCSDGECVYRSCGGPECE